MYCPLCFYTGKLDRRPKGLNSLGGLVFLQDSVSKQNFLVDTGAAVSVFPHKSGEASTGPALVGADGKNIASWGKVSKRLVFGAASYLCTFILAAVTKPILGVDFLAAHRLLVDPFSRTVLSADSLKPVGAAVSVLAARFAASISHIAPAVRSLLTSFPGVVGDGSGTPRPLHGFKHSIETTGRPVFAKARRLDAEKLRIAEDEFRSLEKAGIVRRSNSPWSSPLHMVPKPDGSWRPCGDYRRLNTATVPDRYPLPSILDLSSKLHGCRYFSVVDLVKGYHQVPMDEADIAKTAIITPFGLFEYLFMPFGLSNAAQTFQRLMDRLFRPLPFVFTYLDDHLIASVTLEEHFCHLRQFFEVLQTSGLTINPEKCVFAATALKFLGHLVNEKGIQPLPRHLTAIQEFPPPTDVKQLQRYLGMVNFYRRFLPGIAKVLQPLTDLLRGSPKVLDWPPEAAVAFTASKKALVGAVPLSHPAPNAVLSLATDASDTHVGGVLQQLSPRGWQPLAFFSKKLTAAEVKYSTFDRELLGAFLSVRHFRFLLEGRAFRLLTDHKPLVAAMTRVSPPWSARVQRQLAYLSEFTSDVRHTPGLENVVADALSRPPTPVSVAPVSQLVAAAATTAGNPAVDMELLAAAQRICPEVEKMRSSPSLSISSQVVGDATLYGDLSTGKFRPLLPPSFRQAACEALHNIHHPGVKGTVKLVCQSYCWPHMAKFVSVFARQCLFCQKGKIHRHVSLAAAHIPVPIRRFAHIHVDIVGPLPVSNSNMYLFTILDRTTRWPEAVPMAGTTAAACADALLAGWIQRFGVPSTITSDRGPQFTSALWAAVCRLLNISHLQTTAYHPQANGLVERFHRRLKDALRARAAGVNWHSHLPWVMLGIRSAWREDAEFTPAEAVFGSQPVLPGQFLDALEPPSPTFLADFQGLLAGRVPLPTAHHAAEAPMELPEDLLLSRFVLVRHDAVQPPLSPLYDGPFLVLERSLHAFKLQMGSRVDTVSTHRLKACHAPEGTVAASPPKRGRPAAPAQPLLPPCRRVLPPATSGDAPATSGGPATSGRSPGASGGHRRRVSFSCKAEIIPQPTPQSAKGRPVRNRRQPLRYQP